MKIPRRDKRANEIFKHFEKKFALGEVGVAEAVCIASMFLVGQRPFSLIVVSPSGQLKSSLTADVLRIFPKYTVLIKSRHTPVGLSKDYGISQLGNKTWVNNDMVRTFTGISKVKIEEIVGFYSELMSEKTSGSSTAFSVALDKCKMNMIGNIALVSYKSVQDKFISSTFAERILFLSYVRDKNVIREKTIRDYPLCNQLQDIKLETTDIVVTKNQKKEIYLLSDDLTKIAHYEKFSMRPDEIVESFLCSYALLNGRKKLMKSDFQVFRDMMPLFKRVV